MADPARLRAQTEGGRPAGYAQNLNSRSSLIDLNQRLFGQQTEGTRAPDDVDRLLVTVHKATNLNFGCCDWKAPHCVAILNTIYRTSPKGAAYGENPVWDWDTELRHTGKEEYLIFEVRNGSANLGVAYLPLDVLRRFGELSKALPLMHNGRISGLDGNAGELQELFVTVKCSYRNQFSGGLASQEEQALKMKINRARRDCSQVRVSMLSLKIDMTNNDTEAKPERLMPYVKVFVGREQVNNTITAFVPHYTEAEEFVFQDKRKCDYGGFARGRNERYEGPPVAPPTGSQARQGYRKNVDGNLGVLFRDTRFTFWYSGQEDLDLHVMQDYALGTDDTLVSASVPFEDLFKSAFAGDEELAGYARTGTVTAPLKAIELEITANNRELVVGEISFEVEFIYDPIACPSLFEGLFRRIRSMRERAASKHLEALAAVEGAISTRNLAEMLQGVRPDVCIALSNIVIGAAIFNHRRLVIHEEDGAMLQERIAQAVQDIAAALQLPRYHVETLDAAVRATVSPVCLKKSAEEFRARCAETGVSPLRPVVGLVHALATSRSSYGSVLHSALEVATENIGPAGPVGEVKFDGKKAYGLIERFVTLTLPPMPEYKRIHPHCMTNEMIFEHARNVEPEEMVVDDAEKDQQLKQGKAALSSFLPSIDPSRIWQGVTHPGDEVALVKNSKATLLIGSMSMGAVAGVAGGLGVSATAKMIHNIDHDVFCNPKYQSDLGFFKYICDAMNKSSADEILANWLATRKGFVAFFWIYWIMFFTGTYSRLLTRFQRIRELTLEPTGTARSRHSVVCISGFLNSRVDIFRPWEVDPNYPWTYGQPYVLRWETDLLLKLGEVFQGSLAKAANTTATAAYYLMSLTNPVSFIQNVLYSIQEEVDDVFDLAIKRAFEAGKHLANGLLASALAEADQRAREEAESEQEDSDADLTVQVEHHPRPVSLVGFSFGSAVIIGCLQELRRISNSIDSRAPIAANLICDVVIIGCPIGCSTSQWTDYRHLASGRFVNAYLRSDRELYRRQIRYGCTNKFAGCNSLHKVPGIENKSVDEICSIHANYLNQMPAILSYIFSSD